MIPYLPAQGSARIRARRQGLLQQIGLVLAMAGVCLAGERLAHALWVWQAGIHVLGVAPPLLLAGLILRPRRDWPALALGALFGAMLALLTLGVRPFDAALLALGPPLAAVLMAVALTRWPLIDWPPQGLWQGIGVLLGAGLLLPLFDANWLLAWSRRFDFGYYAEDGRGLLLAQIGGHLLLLPLVLDLVRGPPHVMAALARRLAIAGILFAVPILLWTVPALAALPSALLTVASLPLLLWVLVEFGVAGVSVTLLLLTLIGVRLSLAGLGPFSGLPIDRATLGLQTWICVMAAAMWLMAVLLEQRRSVARHLARVRRQLGELAGRALVVQEEERTRIARELHDDINQQLAAVSIRLSQLKRGGDAMQREEIGAIQQDLLKVSSDIRGMSHELHPSVLRFTGLSSALHAFCHNHSGRTTLQIECDVDAPDGLDGDSELGLFRIVQEAVNNVEKHARATRVWVHLQVTPDGCVLCVSDDGVGIGANGDALPRMGLGLISMEERARQLGGTLAIETRTAGGTRIVVRFPRPARAAEP